MPILCPQDRVGKEFLRSSSPLFTANIFLGMTVVLCCSKEEPDNLPLTLEYYSRETTMRTMGYFGIKKVQFYLEKSEYLPQLEENREGFDKLKHFFGGWGQDTQKHFAPYFSKFTVNISQT